MFMNQVSARYRPLAKSEQIELVNRAKDGDREATARLFDAIMPMVVRIADKVAYGSRRKYLIDFIQEGCIGVMNALKDFDPNRAAWNTYAGNGARLAMLSFVERNKRHARMRRLKANLRQHVEIADKRSTSPDGDAISEVVKTCQSVKKSLRRRDPRGFKIIQHRLSGGTLDTAGKELGVSGKRAHVIYHRTMSSQLSAKVAAVVVCRDTAYHAITTLTK